jgi:hypothetical protein
VKPVGNNPVKIAQLYKAAFIKTLENRDPEVWKAAWIKGRYRNR